MTDYRYDSDDRLIDVHRRTMAGMTFYRHKFAYDITGAVTEFSDVFGVAYGSGVKYGGDNRIGQLEGEKYGHKLRYGQFRYGQDSWTKYGQVFYGEPGAITPGQTDIPGRIKYGMGQKKSSYAYDTYSRLTEYTDYFGEKYYYGYDSLGRNTLIRYPNGVITEYLFYSNGKLQTIKHQRIESDGTRTLLESFTYEYDGNSNITKITNSDGSYIDYVYDDWNRLTRETKKDSGDVTLYDIQYSFATAAGDTGNIYQKTVTIGAGSPETTTYSYDSYNKLTGITYHDSTTETFTYDDNGQLTKREKSTGETTEYVWNDMGLLTKVILPTGEPVEYTYDGANQLIGRKDSENDDVFVQSGWNIVTEKDNNQTQNGCRTYYTGYSSNKNDDNNGTKYFHYDHLGNTRLITDENGNILNSLYYQAYGNVIDNNGNSNNHLSLKSTSNLFVGAYGIRYDIKTNLNYMRFRWYSCDFLRFIEPDPINNLNRYIYADGNPVSYVDPMGLDTGTLIWQSLPGYQKPSFSIPASIKNFFIDPQYMTDSKNHPAFMNAGIRELENLDKFRTLMKCKDNFYSKIANGYLDRHIKMISRKPGSISYNLFDQGKIVTSNRRTRIISILAENRAGGLEGYVKHAVKQWDIKGKEFNKYQNIFMGLVFADIIILQNAKINGYSDYQAYSEVISFYDDLYSYYQIKLVTFKIAHALSSEDEKLIQEELRAIRVLRRSAIEKRRDENCCRW